MKRIARIFIAAAAGVEFLAREAALACAVCGLDAEPGFLWSMGFLIAMPFAIAAIAGGCFLYGARRGKGSAGEERDFTKRLRGEVVNGDADRCGHKIFRYRGLGGITEGGRKR